MFSLLLLLACSSAQDPTENSGTAPTDPAPIATQSIEESLGMDRLQRARIDPILGEPLDYAHYTVRPLSLQVFDDFRISGALYEPKETGPKPAFLMAHGHFGEGKSSGEAQAPAHALAHRGYVVLALDTPGVEEGDRADRQIHFEAGKQNRERLEAAGSSAMALQLHGLQAGLDYFDTRTDVEWVAAGGASGGATQAFYLSLVDPRPKALVMASFVPLPRERKEGGCPCDWFSSGWNSNSIAELHLPSLWMSEGAEGAPPDLPQSARFVTHSGPHGFERPMIDESVAWLDVQHELEVDRPLPVKIPHSPSTALASASVGSASIEGLIKPASPNGAD